MQIQIQLDELRKRKIFLAVPMYGGNCSGMFTRSVADLTAKCAAHGIQIQIYFLFNESLITRARNYCCDEFMRSDATHLMFIDSDIGFQTDDVLALLAMSSEDSLYDVIGGPYPKKTISWEKIKKAVDKGFADENPNKLEAFVGDFVFNPIAGTDRIPINEPVQVLEIGTGFMMIQRRTLEKFQEAYPHLWYRPDHVRTEHFDGTREIMAYFDCVIDRGYNLQKMFDIIKDLATAGDGHDDDMSDNLHYAYEDALKLIEAEKTSSKRYLSEDYKFCQDVIAAGQKIWLCPWMKLQHAGTYIFGGSLVDLAQIGASATVDPTELKKIKDSEKKERG
jgi:hypothetical protein